MKINTLYDIHKLLGLQKLSPYSYNGTFGTGNFDALHDYDAGLLSVGISVIADKDKDSKTIWQIIFHISTIDDGVWQALNPTGVYHDRKEASAQIDILAEAFIEFMDRSTKLPSEKEINKFLMNHGYWGEYTG